MSIVEDFNTMSNNLRTNLTNIDKQITIMIDCFEDIIVKYNIYSKETILLWLKAQKNELYDISRKLL